MSSSHGFLQEAGRKWYLTTDPEKRKELSQWIENHHNGRTLPVLWKYERLREETEWIKPWYEERGKLDEFVDEFVDAVYHEAQS